MDDTLALLIPLSVVICIFGGPFLLVGFFAYLWARVRTERYKTVREYLNRGLPVPPELLHGKPPGGPAPMQVQGPATSVAPPYYPPVKSPAKRDFRRGITLTFTGMAISLAFYFVWPHSTSWAWGLIPWVIGVGYLASYYLDPEDRLAPPQPASAPEIPPSSTSPRP